MTFAVTGDRTTARAWSAPRLVLRQLPSVVLGWALALGVVALVAFLLVTDPTHHVLMALLLGVALLAWLYLGRPRVSLHDEGVEIRNPLTTTMVDWGAVEDGVARWNLEVWSSAGTHGAVAVSAARPVRSHGLQRSEQLQDEFYVGDAAGKVESGRMTPARAADLVRQAKGEWDEGVSLGLITAPSDPGVRHRRHLPGLVASVLVVGYFVVALALLVV
ncbi:PH domain-containing protein [Janibacter sp. G1551]|uniref:PH domain-containing protein n=1 Tax=Janibacter sp. G1551 TaxID=3420440 RepID=UPI003CFC61BD